MRRIGLAVVLALSLTLAPLAVAAQASTHQEALQALEGLRSVTQAGLSLAEYERRVLDAKVVADRYLSVADPGQPRRQRALAKALGLHLTARSWWRYTVMPNEPRPSSANQDCAPAATLFARSTELYREAMEPLQRQAQEIQAQIRHAGSWGHATFPNSILFGRHGSRVRDLHHVSL